jgi:hypothetical protein
MYENCGVLIFAVQDLFQKIQNQDENINFEIKLSYIEVYNEEVYDLLAINSSGFDEVSTSL